MSNKFKIAKSGGIVSLIFFYMILTIPFEIIASICGEFDFTFIRLAIWKVWVLLLAWEYLKHNYYKNLEG